MNLTEFAQQLEDGDLFRNVTPAQKGLVRLVRTSVLQDWLSSRGNPGRIAWQLESVLSLLLERRVLSLAVREEPEPLVTFWRWACDASYAPEGWHGLWDGGLLPETLGGAPSYGRSRIRKHASRACWPSCPRRFAMWSS